MAVTGCNCCETGQIQCYPGGFAKEVICLNAPQPFWYDTETNAVVAPHLIDNCNPLPESVECTAATENSELQGVGHNILPEHSLLFCYGTSPSGPYTTCTESYPGDNSVNQPFQSLPVTGLTPGATYYFTAQVRDGGNNILKESSRCQFTVPLTTNDPSVNCAPATNVSSDSATLQGVGHNVPEDHDFRICYGTTPGGPYGTCGPLVNGNIANNQPISETITTTPETTYYYVVELYDAVAALIQTSEECQVTTPPTDIVVTNFPNGTPNPEFVNAIENARVILNDGFITAPVLHNGDRQVHVDILFSNDCSATTLAFGGPTTLRPDGTTYGGRVTICTQNMTGRSEDENTDTMLHEMLHVLGMGTSPNWDNFVSGDVWTGPQALSAYQAMVGGFPGATGIPLQAGNGHWYEGPGHSTGQQCLDNDLMSPIADPNETFTDIDTRALRDIGYDYNGAYGTPIACGA